MLSKPQHTCVPKSLTGTEYAIYLLLCCIAFSCKGGPLVDRCIQEVGEFQGVGYQEELAGGWSVEQKLRDFGFPISQTAVWIDGVFSSLSVDFVFTDGEVLYRQPGVGRLATCEGFSVEGEILLSDDSGRLNEHLEDAELGGGNRNGSGFVRLQLESAEGSIGEVVTSQVGNTTGELFVGMHFGSDTDGHISVTQQQSGNGGMASEQSVTVVDW